MSDRFPDIGVPHYRVLSRLGAGGMGEVWLAEDTRLGRKVAIKLLPAEATRNVESVRRFVQEARAASALNHPHIVTVHDIGESAKTFDRELSDVFAVQDEISEAIAASIVSDLHRVEHASAQRRPPESLEAWGLYQRAVPLIETFTREDAAEARRLLERSVALDPTFASPLARLAELSIWDAVFSWTDTPEEGLMTGLEQARRAVALDPMDPDAHSFLAWMLMTVGQIGEGGTALEEAKRALELNPSSIWALMIHALVWCMTGHDADVSVAQVERAMRLSPHDPAEYIFYDIGSAAHLNAGRYEAGLAFGRRLIALRPNYYWGHLWCAANAAGAGKLDEARNLIREAREIQPEVSIALVRQSLGAMAPEVDQRLAGFLAQAGLGE